MSKLRIKYKRLKRELDVLKNRTGQPKFITHENREVIRLADERIIDMDKVKYFSEEDIMDMMIKDLMRDVKKYIHVESGVDHFTGRTRFRATINIVPRLED